MTVELKMLVLAVLIPLLMVSCQGVLLMQSIGLSPLLGNRDTFPSLSGWPGRYVRAHGNQIENLILFGFIVLVAHAAAVSNPVTQIAAEVFVVCRLLHALTYIVGIRYIRTAAFYGGLVCIYALGSQLF